MKTWQCFGCSYHCKCTVEDSQYCTPKKCVAFDSGSPDWKPVKEGEKDDKEGK